MGVICFYFFFPERKVICKLQGLDQEDKQEGFHAKFMWVS